MAEDQQATNWSQYRLVIGLSFVQSFVWGLVLSMFPLFARELGAKEFAIGALAAVHPLLSVVGAVPMGLLANRFSRRGMFVLAYVLSLLAAISYACTTRAIALVVPQFLFGLSMVAYWPTQHSHISDNIAPAERARMFGLAMGLTGTGGIIGPVFAGRIADAYGFQVMYICLAVVTLAGLALCIWVKSPPGWEGSRAGVGTGPRLTLSGMRELLGRPALRFVMTCTVVMFVQWGLRDTFLPLYAADLSLTRTAIGALVTVQTISMCASRLALGFLGRRAPAGRAILIFVFAAALVTLAVPALSTFGALAAVSFIAGIGSGVCVPLNLTNIANATYRHERPMAMSLESAAASFGRLFSSLTFGWVAGVLGIPAIFIIGNLLVLAGVAWLARIPVPGLGREIEPQAAAGKSPAAAGAAAAGPASGRAGTPAPTAGGGSR
jgi:MFS family permease